MPRVRAKGKKPSRRDAKTEHQVPVTEPVIQPTSETDPWLVPVAKPEEADARPELPESLSADLLAPLAEENEKVAVLPPPVHGRKLMWAGVLLCMAVILGGWIWSFRFSLRLPTSGGELPMTDAINQFRTQAAALGQGLDKIRSEVSALTPASKKSAAPAASNQVIDALKQKVTEVAGDQ